MQSILIVEDEEIIRTSLNKLLTREGFEVRDARHIDDALKKYQLNEFSLIISDLRLPGAKGTELINMADNVPVLIMTSYASLRSAVDIMRMGAADYIAKPYDHNEMITAVRRILNNSQKRTANDTATVGDSTQECPHQTKVLADTTNDPIDHSDMIGSSPAMQTVFDVIQKAAPTDAPILIFGEIGTGKKLAARAIHNQSPRKQHPFVSVNCATTPKTQIEAELFGYEKNAFDGASEARTGLIASADKGTLFLNEIDKLPKEAQTRLMRLLQDGEVHPLGTVQPRKINVRLVVATHRDLKQLCQQKTFREDLYYRINVVNLHTPALRDRGKDILKIANHLLLKYSHKYHKTGQTLTPRAIQALTSHHWPGNIRQLENSLQRAVILCADKQTISHELLGLDLTLSGIPDCSSNPETTPISTLVEHDSPDELSLEDYFTQFVQKHQDNLNETELARKLGISRKSLWQRRQKLGITRN